MEIIKEADTIEEAARNEHEAYKLYNDGTLLCVDIAKHKYVKISSKDAKGLNVTAAESTTVKGYLMTQKLIKASYIAQSMWPNNKNAESYLTSKLTGKRPFTVKDAKLAKAVLDKLAAKFFTLTVTSLS